MDKIKECVNCGAAISAEDAECPYCHYMQYDAAEARYMDTLESMNDSMGSLDRNTRKIARKDIVKSVLITLAAAAVFAGIGSLSGIVHEKTDSYYYGEKSRIVKGLDWYDANADALDKAYEDKDFAGIYKIINADSKGPYYSILHNWEHYDIYQIYTGSYDRFEQYMTDEDRDGQYVFETLYRNAISTLELEYKKDSVASKLYARCSDDEKKIVDGWLANVKKFLKDDAGLTEEQCRADYNDLYSSGYMDYSKSSEYAQKYYNAKGGTQ